MSRKVLLVRPGNIYNYNNYPPLSLISVGSALKSRGYDVKIINCAHEKDYLKKITEESKDSLFLGISMLTSEIMDAYGILKHVRESSDIPIVAGGWHCTLFPEQMAKCGYVDYVVSGEGEEHIVKIAQHIENKEKISEKIFHKKAADLELLPAPDYSLDENIEYFINSYLTDKLSQFVRQPMRWLPYESSRGCPSRCTFCINVVSDNNHYRKKSPEKVVSEIEFLVKKYKLTHLKIIDDNFFVDIKRVRSICEKIVEKGLDITWDGECRCDYFNDNVINDETLRLLKKSGLIQLTLGIESGSPYTLKQLMKKDITPEEAENAVKKCNEYKIIARSSFMIEVPGERSEDIKKTVSFISRLRKYPYFTCGLGTFRPYPKCELTQKLLEEGYLAEPDNFEGWVDRDIIDIYTSLAYIAPWQVNGKRSESVSYYVNMESAIRLGNYLLDRKSDRFKNNIFILLAKLRNRLFFYNFPFEKELYKKFFTECYRRIREAEIKALNN